MKKRPPLKQLVDAGKMARETLSERKIILPDEKSAIAKILQTKGAPILPGSNPPYLPYPWTINIARRIIYDFGRAWQKEINNDDKRKSNGLEFFKYVIEGLNRPKSVIDDLIEKTVSEKTYDQKYLSRKETIDALKRFFVDSFAVSVIIRSHTDTVDYLEWFLDWSNSLLNLWPENIRMIDGKKTDEKSNDSNTTKNNIIR